VHLGGAMLRKVPEEGKSEATSDGEDDAKDDTKEEPRFISRPMCVAVGALVALGLLIGFAHRELIRQLPLAAWAHWLREHYFVGGWMVGTSYFVVALMAIPGGTLPITLAAGWMWGPVRAWLVIWPTAVMAASVAFVVGRTVLRHRVSAFVAKRPLLVAIDKAIDKRGAALVWIVRASPAFPATVMSYALAATNVPAKHYFLATAACFCPGVFFASFIGSSAQDFADLSQIPLSGTSVAHRVGYVLGFALTAAAVYWISRAASNELRALEAEGSLGLQAA